MSLIVQLIVGLVLSLAATLIQAALTPRQKPPGLRGEIAVGGDNPLAFILGRYATAGQLEYAGTWGEVDQTPNAYFTKVVSLSDLPVRGLTGLYVNGARVTLDGTADPDLGYPVTDYRVDGDDYLWVKVYDGSQTVADAFLLAVFGGDPDHPWLSDMIGLGLAVAIVTARINRELFPNLPDYLFEMDGIALDDPRVGDPVHDNVAVAIRTVMLGLSYDGVWLYGPQGVTEDHLVDWQPQMDKCDQAVPLAAGGDEPRFRCGMEVRCDVAPHATVAELLKAGAGRIAEDGGRYRLLIGEPDDPVAAFTDDDVIVSDGQLYEPFPGLDATHNAITASYPEPDEAWEMKEAPPRYSSALESEDDGRRLPVHIDYPAAPWANQVQRLMRAAIEEERRFRRHSHTMPPDWWAWKPLDAVAWTSARNGYVAKGFLITAIEDRGDAHQVAGFQEIDPADHDWETGFELPFDTAPVVFARPPAQAMTGWQVAPYTFVDAGSNARRPSIEVSFDGGLDDVRAVAIQVRLAATAEVVFDGETPYDIGDPAPSVALNGTFIRDTAYQARGRFIPFSGRATEWSAWLAVTTPDVGITEADLDAEVQAWLQQLDVDREAALAPILTALDERVAALGQTVAGVVALINERIDGPGVNAIVNYIGNANAAITEVRTVADGLADLFIDVFAGNEVAAGNALLRLTAGTGPLGTGASAKFAVRALAGDILKEAGVEIWAEADESGGLSGWVLYGDKGKIRTPAGDYLDALMITTQDVPDETAITVEGADNVIRANLAGRRQRHLTIIDDDAEMRAPVGITPMDYTHIIEQDGAGGHALAYSDEFLAPTPTGLSTLAGALNILGCRVLSTNPIEIAASLIADPFTRTPTITHRDADGGIFTSGTVSPVFSLSALDFVPGSVLVALAFAWRDNHPSSPFGSDWPLSDNTPADWALIASAGAFAGSVGHRWRVNAFWKIADGAETTFQPMVYGAPIGSPVAVASRLVIQVFSLDALGGVVKLDAAPSAVVSTTAIGTQTIETADHAEPDVAFSFAGYGSLSGGLSANPDQTFSETPTQNIAHGSGALIRSRTKTMEWPTTPSDVTTDLPVAGGAGLLGLLSFALYMD